MGTPEFATLVLKELINNCNVVLVVSQPDKEIGRKHVLTYSPVKELAVSNNIEVFQPIKIRKDYDRIKEVNPDIIITCAYGQIIPKEVLDIPKYGCINVHASLLPYLRGGAPLNHAIIDGYEKTGVTIMYMDEGMDTGDIISTYEYNISDTTTFGDLADALSLEGSKLLIKTLPHIIDGSAKRIKQDDKLATYAYVIKREEEHIDFNKSVIEVDRLVRGLNPYPYANTIIGDIEYKIIKGHFKKEKSIPNKINVINKKELGIGCSDGIYYIDEIKPSGKKIMDIKSFLNGTNIDTFNDKIIK